MKSKKISVSLLLALALLGTAPGKSASGAEMAYDRQLMRLAEVLGSLHYLRALCGEQNGLWRARMETLLEAEKPNAERRARMIAGFNHGFSSFASVYKSCTKSAITAIDRYMKEGEQLSTDIVQRYGN